MKVNNDRKSIEKRNIQFFRDFLNLSPEEFLKKLGNDRINLIS